MAHIRNSHSAKHQFLFCERQFFYRRVMKIAEPPSVHLAVGNLYHDLAADAMLNIEITPLLIKQRILQHKQKDTWCCPVSDAVLIKEVENNMKRLVDDVFPHFTPMEDLATGQPLVERWERGTYFGKIDLVANETPVVDDRLQITGTEPEPCIVDWKTKSNLNNRKMFFDQSKHEQGTLYCLMREVKSVAFVEIPRDWRAPIHTLVHTYTTAELGRWKRYHDAQFAAMQSRGGKEEEYKLADPSSPLCSSRWCAYWDRCPGGEGK